MKEGIILNFVGSNVNDEDIELTPMLTVSVQKFLELFMPIPQGEPSLQDMIAFDQEKGYGYSKYFEEPISN